MMCRGPGHAHLWSGVVSRDLHTLSFQLNISTFCGIGGVEGVFRGGAGSVYEVMLTGDFRPKGCLRGCLGYLFSDRNGSR
jgi:hypothetical protein